MPIIDENGYWWLDANNKEDWYLKAGDTWYVFKGGKLQSPQDTKGKPSSDATQYRLKDQLGIRYSSYRCLTFLLAAILGVSLALNVWMALSY
jgi:hypothetical protein